MSFQFKLLIISACYLYQVLGTNQLLVDPCLQQSRGCFGCALQSWQNISSIRTTAQPNDQHASGSTSNPNEFVNQGKRDFMSALAQKKMPMSFTSYRFRIIDCLFHSPIPWIFRHHVLNKYLFVKIPFLLI